MIDMRERACRPPGNRIYVLWLHSYYDITNYLNHGRGKYVFHAICVVLRYPFALLEKIETSESRLRSSLINATKLVRNE